MNRTKKSPKRKSPKRKSPKRKSPIRKRKKTVKDGTRLMSFHSLNTYPTIMRL